eukprot:SAG11_NODE_9688_length_889_cov_5.878481_1_plen_196_part_10
MLAVTIATVARLAHGQFLREAIVSVPRPGDLCPPYAPRCTNEWAQDGATVGDVCTIECRSLPDGTRWCPSGPDHSGDEGTPWGWCAQYRPQEPRWPGEQWERRAPEAEGMSPELLERAFAYAGEPRMNSHCATIHRNGVGAPLGNSFAPPLPPSSSSSSSSSSSFLLPFLSLLPPLTQVRPRRLLSRRSLLGRDGA